MKFVSLNGWKLKSQKEEISIPPIVVYCLDPDCIFAGLGVENITVIVTDAQT